MENTQTEATNPGVEGNHIPGLTNHWLARISLYSLIAFPLIDFGLRHLPHLHPLGVLWDKILLLVLLGIAIKRWMNGHRPQWFGWHKYALWYIIYALALMFYGMSQPMISFDGLRADVYYMLYAFLIPFVVAPKDVMKLLHAAATIAILIGVDGVYQYVTKVPIPVGWVDVGEHVRTRVFSVLTSPNELGAYMVMMTPLIAGLFLYESQNRIRKWLYGAGTIICLFTLLVTYTRGALIGLVLAVLVTAVLFERRLLIPLGVLVVVAFMIPSIHHRIVDVTTPLYFVKSAQAGRIERWLTAFDEFTQNPLFGAGIGQYGGQVAADFKIGTAQYSDGFYTKTFGESGMIGLGLFLLLHVSIVLEMISKTVRPARGRLKVIALGGVTGMLAVLFHSTIENVFEFAPMAALYFSLASLYTIWGRGMQASAADTVTEAVPVNPLPLPVDTTSIQPADLPAPVLHADAKAPIM